MANNSFPTNLRGASFVKCPACALENRADKPYCWGCGAELPPAEAMETPPGAALSFSLNSLMLVVTLIACCLGLGAVAPGWAAFVGILAVPAFVRTLGFTSLRRRHNQPATPTEKVVNFVVSLGLMLGIILVTSIVVFTVAYGFVVVGIGIALYFHLPILLHALAFLFSTAIGISWLSLAGWLYYCSWGWLYYHRRSH